MSYINSENIQNDKMMRKFEELRIDFRILERSLQSQVLFPIRDIKDDDFRKIISDLMQRIIMDINDFSKILDHCSPWDPRGCK